MKRTLVAIMLLLFTMSIAGIASAASNTQFADVPAGSWAYDAVNQLAKAGIVSGYDDGTFRGDKTMTRYEMAQVVANALTKETKANAEQKELIKKLNAEFASELKSLGVEVANLKKTSSSIKMSGYDRISYQRNDGLSGYTNGAAGASATNRYRMRNDFKLFMSSNINDTMRFDGTVYYRVQNSGAYATTGNKNDETREGTFGFSNFFVTMNNIMPSATLTMGRLHAQVANGLMFAGDYFDGAQLTFGNKLKGFIGYGDYTYMPGPDFLGKTVAGNYPVQAKIAGLQYDTSKATTLYAGYFGSGNNTPYNYSVDNNANPAPVHSILFSVYDLGFKSNITPKLEWTGEYARNNHSTVSSKDIGDKTAWFTALKYGKADKAKSGSHDIYVKYLKRGADAIDWRGSLVQFPTTFTLKNNIQGTTVGYDVTIAKNAILNLEYAKYQQFSTATNAGGTDYNPFYQCMLSFWF